MFVAVNAQSLSFCLYADDVSQVTRLTTPRVFVMEKLETPQARHL